MSVAAFTFTDRVRPIVEVGIGDSRIPTGQAQWGVALWDNDQDLWAGTEPTWLDVTCDVQSIDMDFGRLRSTERFTVGTATVVVDNVSGWADPNMERSTTATLHLRPGRAIRIGVHHVELGPRWLWRGFIDAMAPTYDSQAPDDVRLSCVDALGEVNRAKLTPLYAPVGDQSASVRVTAILDRVPWPTEKRKVEAASTVLLPSTLDGQVADLLGVAADSIGGVIYGDVDGDIVLRNREWQTYPPGTPPDGTIGNVGATEEHWESDLSATIILPGVAGNYLSVPHAANLSNPAYTIDLIARLSVTDVAATFDCIAAKWVDTTQRSWRWTFAPGGIMQFRISQDGSTQEIASSAPVPIVNGQTMWLRSLWRKADRRLQFFTAPDVKSNTEPVRWYQLGDTLSTAAAAAFASTAAVTVGAANTGTVEPFAGRIHRLILRDGTTTRLDVSDADAEALTGSTFPAATGQTVTVNKTASYTPVTVTDTPVLVPASDGDVCPVAWERPYERADITTRVILGRNVDGDVPRQHDDLIAQALFGVEPFERRDLLTADTSELDRIGSRLLVTRGATSAPRVRSVTLDAATSTAALDLMATVDVFAPSRYRCRLIYPEPRGLVFDAEHYATGAHHHITPDTWQLNLDLDLSAVYEASGGLWNVDQWNQTTWAA